MDRNPRAPRTPRSRGLLHYEKPAMTLNQLVDRMAERGLIIRDRERAVRYLRHIGYYRLSPYTIPFQRGLPDHTLREGTSFDDVLDLCIFDRALRLLVMDALKRVEVAMRAALTDHMSTTYDDPHWYTNGRNFKNLSKHGRLLKIVRDSIENQLRASAEPIGIAGTAGSDDARAEDAALVHRSALEHYLTTYASPEFPPSWLMVETLTIGQLSNIYRNLRRRSDRTAIARSLGLTDPVLRSWMQTYVRVRNVCAHHGRLWNLGLGVYPAIPNTPSIAWLIDSKSLPEGSK